MKTVREMTVNEVGYTVPWQCVLSASGVIEVPEKATVEATGGGTRCIEVIKLDDGTGVGRFAHEISNMTMSEVRRYFKREGFAAN